MTENPPPLVQNMSTRLSAAAATHRVPGASIALHAGEILHEAACGVVNVDTGVEATTDALFHLASITKPMTTTMAMQFVDEGKLDLDAPVRRYLPDFRVASEEAAGRMTVRQLLCHASGIDGDLFIETTRGHDRLVKLVEAGRDLPQLHEPGQGFSYCNHGFAVAGRLFESLDGSDFDMIWRERISARLGVPSLLTLPEDALRYRVAVGHAPSRSGPVVPKRMFLSTSAGPAGSTPMGRARDLVWFALAHLDGGMARGGQRLVSGQGVRAMQQPHTALPSSAPATHFGLGWMLFNWGDKPLFGHDGVSVFQRSFLRVLPEKRMVFSLLTNGGDGAGLFRDLASGFFGEAGAPMPPVPKPAEGTSIDARRFVGTYARFGTVTTVEEVDGALAMSSTWTEEWARDLYGRLGPFALKPVNDTLFVWRTPGAEPTLVTFTNEDGSGQFRSLYAGMRLSHRR